MNVTAIFDSQYEGELAGAIWILDTAPNRVRFEESTGLDPNSALFSTKSHETPKSAPVRIIWSIMDHHPDFEKIVVIGVDHDASISKKLKEDCETEATSEGFIFWRGNGSFVRIADLKTLRDYHLAPPQNFVGRGSHILWVRQ